MQNIDGIIITVLIHFAEYRGFFVTVRGLGVGGVWVWEWELVWVWFILTSHSANKV